MRTLLISCLIHSFLEIEQKNQKPKNQKIKSASRFCILIILILNGAQNFKFTGFCYATLIGLILYTFQDTSTRLS